MPVPPTSTSLTLLSRIRSGDEASWQRLVEIYGPFLLGRLKRRGLSEPDAEDVLQDVFATVARKIADFRRDLPSDSFLHWLQTITSSRLADFHRRRQRSVSAVGGTSLNVQLEQYADPLADEDWSTDTQAQQTVLARILEVLKTEFQENTWRSFWLFAIDGKTTDDISHELGMTSGAIRQARSKVRKRLAEEFRDLIEPDGG
ncbi:MAG: RNA polymerase sigma factor [Planctomycetaceae bacterium]